jgi:MFS transporter, CP family, cyanate transporter
VRAQRNQPIPAGRAFLAARRPRAGLVLLAVGIMVLALNMRAAITSLPPVFPELQAALHLSSASVAVLAAAPVACFAVFSGLGAPVSRAFGEERVLLAALVLLAGGLVLRGAVPAAMLFPGTVLAGGAIALMNVLLPSLVKRRSPDRAGLLIGAYLLMLSVGAVTASLIAVPVFRAAGGSGGGAGWPVKITLGLWAVPALAAAVAWLPQVRYRTRPAGTAPSGAGPRDAQPRQAEPRDAEPRHALPVGAGPAQSPEASQAGRTGGRIAVRRHALAWQVAAFMGLQSLSYYAALSWLPTLLRDRGVSAAGAGGLLALMGVGNLPTGLLVPVLAHRARDQRLLAAATIAVTAAGLAGAQFAPVGSAAGWMFLLGLGQGSSLGLAIFFTMARAPDPATAASLSAFAQATGYLLATAGPLAVEFLHAATGGWTVPVITLLGCVGLQLWAGLLAGRELTLGP